MPQSRSQFHDGKAGAAITVQIISPGKKEEIMGILEDGTIKIVYPKARTAAKQIMN